MHSMGDAVEIHSPYLLFLGDARDQLAAKTANGVRVWRSDWCLGQLRLPGCNADCGVPDMSIEEAAAAVKARHGDKIMLSQISLRQPENSMPRSKVIDWRAAWGRGSMTFISRVIKCVELRSLFRNKTAYRVLRSTSEATLAFPCSRRKIIKSPSHSPNVARSLI